MTTIWSRVWPNELAVHRENPKAVPLVCSTYAHACPNCGGSGLMMVYVIKSGPYQTPSGKVKWLDLQPPAVSGWYEGSLETAPCPVCAGGQMDAYLERNCGLRGDDLTVSLADFKTNGKLAGKEKALAAARSLLAMNRQPSGFVTFTGGYGVGKTHLLKAIVNGFRGLRVIARYSTMADLLADIRERFGGDNGVRAVEDAIGDLNRAHVLCIDEIDRINLTGWAKETLFRLLNQRYESRNSLLTVVATNARIDEMPPELGYLASRFSAGIVVEVPGPDMRPAQGLKMAKEINEKGQERD